MAPHENKQTFTDRINKNPEKSSIGLSKEDIAGLSEHIEAVFSVWGNHGSPEYYVWRDIAGAYQARSLLQDYQNDRVGENFTEDLYAALASVPQAVLELSTESDSYRTFVEQARSLSSEKAIEELQVVYGQEDLPIAPHAIKTHLQASIPPVALAALKQVEFDTLSPKSASKHALGEYDTSEVYDGEKPTIRFSVDELNIYYQRHFDRYAEEGLSWDESYKKATDRVFRGISHEFGHALHDFLPTAALKRWDDLVSQDTVAVTKYVSLYFEKDHPKKYTEDFAESMALFIHDPEQLKNLSPARYEGMRQIYDDVMPSYGIASFS